MGRHAPTCSKVSGSAKFVPTPLARISQLDRGTTGWAANRNIKKCYIIAPPAMPLGSDGRSNLGICVALVWPGVVETKDIERMPCASVSFWVPPSEPCKTPCGEPRQLLLGILQSPLDQLAGSALSRIGEQIGLAAFPLHLCLRFRRRRRSVVGERADQGVELRKVCVDVSDIQRHCVPRAKEQLKSRPARLSLQWRQ